MSIVHSSLFLLQEVIALYFDDSAQKLQKLTAKLNSTPPEFAEVDALIHQFKGSSASFGAQALAMICVHGRPLSQQRLLSLPRQDH